MYEYVVTLTMLTKQKETLPGLLANTDLLALRKTIRISNTYHQSFLNPKVVFSQSTGLRFQISLNLEIIILTHRFYTK